MLTSDFSYHLPEELIAQYPAEQRDSGRMLCLDNKAITDSFFKELPAFLNPGDLVVLNDTRVIPARLFAHKETGGKVEIMLERILDESTLLVQLRVSKSPKPGTRIYLDEQTFFEVKGRQDDMYLLQYNGKKKLNDLLEQYGHMPLPPYIDRSDEAFDKERYQTVFSNIPGAVAAPTAGLHFTDDVLNHLREKGVDNVCLTLHVGAGTFQPVRVKDISQHKMHSEYMQLDQSVVEKINRTKQSGGKVLAIGTTVVRSLETAAQSGKLKPYSGETDIFIYPGFEFNVVDMLFTNFHLPESTLLMLVCAFGGKEKVIQAYQHAIQEKYRFYSYGDAMLILNREQ